jgi:spermidine synthase
MAIIWQKKYQNVEYQVRQAGNSRRLYTDGVLHSQYNPSHILTGSVWDLLMLPAFLYPPEYIQKILVLGVGGGAVIHQLHHYIKPQIITGIEYNPVHIWVAQEYFSLDYNELSLIDADAIEWLKRYDGEPFDMIIDDLCCEIDGEPQRAIESNGNWCRQLLKHLSHDGILVMNYPASIEAKSSALLTLPSLKKRYQQAFKLSTPHYDNCVLAFTRKKSSSVQLRKNLQKNSSLDQRKSSCRLRYKIRRL